MGQSLRMEQGVVVERPLRKARAEQKTDDSAGAGVSAAGAGWAPSAWQPLPKHVTVAGQMLCFKMFFKEPVAESTRENHR